MQPVRMALVGIGGYGRWILEMFCNSADLPNPPIEFVAAADPNLAAFPQHTARLEKRGVKLFTSYEELLKQSDAEAVWLPVPINLHRPFVELAMEAGKVAIVEKPVTGTVDDLAAMIAARGRVDGRVAVGFQDIYADTTIQIKKDLLAGQLGTIRSVTVHACMPRPESYYRRNAWAGKMRHNGTWVLDSPANNAIAHFINLALFFLGRTTGGMAKLESVSAELYRVNDIENYDTCSLRIMTEGSVPVLVNFTHACQENVLQQVTLHGDRGSLRYVATQQATWETDGQKRVVPLIPKVHDQMVSKIARWIRGDREVVVASMEMAGAQLAVVNGASQAAKVHTVPCTTAAVGDGDALRYIPQIERLFERCSNEHKMLHELGEVSWSVAPKMIDLRNYSQFAGPAR